MSDGASTVAAAEAEGDGVGVRGWSGENVDEQAASTKAGSIRKPSTPLVAEIDIYLSVILGLREPSAAAVEADERCAASYGGTAIASYASVGCCGRIADLKTSSTRSKDGSYLSQSSHLTARLEAVGLCEVSAGLTYCVTQASITALGKAKRVVVVHPRLLSACS